MSRHVDARFLVVFRARIRRLDDEYAATAARLRELAFSRYGCLDFHAASEGDEEIAVSAWPDEASIAAWRSDPEHVAAKRSGAERWYESWSIEVAEVKRSYRGSGRPAAIATVSEAPASATVARPPLAPAPVVLSVDLAFRSLDDIGVCSLRCEAGRVRVETHGLRGLGLSGEPRVGSLARVLAGLAGDIGARLLLVDGPQAWKSPINGLEHSRIGERELATPGKTGLPGVTKPANYAPFIRFSIDLFDELDALGWPRLRDTAHLDSTEAAAIESFPTSAWRGLGLAPLPGKGKCRPADVEAKAAGLASRFDLELPPALGHDELQAAVAGLAGVGACGHPRLAARLAGAPPFLLDGAWREGWLVTVARRDPLNDD